MRLLLLLVSPLAVFFWLSSRAPVPAPVPASPTATPAPPGSPPPATTVHLTGHGSERVFADRLTWSVDICGASKALALEHAHAAVRAAEKVLDANDVIAPRPVEDGNGEPSCATLDVSTTSVEAALRWHRGLLAARLVQPDEATEPECSGERNLAAARKRAAMSAIADGRAQLDALRRDPISTSRNGLQAEVQTDDGSWDNRCERLVTATADLTIPTS